jgi:hypothetical protein
MAEEEQEQGKKKDNALRAAIIGLVGTLLTVCGGVTGAVISGAVTVYRVERERQQVALAAPGAGQALTVDTEQISISYPDAQALDPDDFYVASDLGFVLAQPREGWTGVEETSYRDLFVDRGAWTGSTWDEQPVRRIHYGEPVAVQYLEETRVNSLPMDVGQLQELYGTDTFQFSNEITVVAVDKEVSSYSLAGVALDWGAINRTGANRIVANDDSDYILMQTSWQMEDVRVDGRTGDLAIERWALFAEGAESYYVVEVVHIPQMGQPVHVWEDLQAYIDSFRVIR